MDRVRMARGSLDRILELAQTGLFGMMVVVGTYQILVRYLFNKPSTVSEELLTYAFAWLSLLAAAYMFGKRGHMRMGFLADRASENGRMALEMVSECLVLLFGAVVMVYGGVRITVLTMAQKTASLGIPMGYVYAIVPACGGLILVYSILNLAQMVGERRRLDAPEREGGEEGTAEKLGKAGKAGKAGETEKAGETGKAEKTGNAEKAGEGRIEREKEDSGEWGKRKESDRT